MLFKVPPIRIGVVCQPCTGRGGLAALAKIYRDGNTVLVSMVQSGSLHLKIAGHLQKLEENLLGASQDLAFS